MSKLTVELQDVILSGLLKSGYILSLVKTEIKDNYFSEPSCRIIYKSLVKFYDKYNKIPSTMELLVEVDNNYVDLGVTIEMVKSKVSLLYTFPDSTEEYLLDKLTEFIKIVRTNKALGKALDLVKSGNGYTNEQLVSQLIDSLNISLSRSKLFTLGNSSNLADARHEAIGDGNSNAVIKSCVVGINESLQYRGYAKGTLNLIVAPPGTGKSSFLVCEGSYASQQGFKVLHVFLGDMIHYDAFIRYAANLSGLLQDEVTAMTSEQQAELITKVNKTYPDVLNRICVLAYGAGEVTCEQLLENIKKEQEKLDVVFDVIVIDYADNLAKDNTNLYAEGGDIYDRLALFGRLNKSVMLVASQPKIGYWKDEIIPLEGAAESSKKQHIVDLMVCFNLVSRTAKLGSMFIPKVRRGTSGRIVRVLTRWEQCRFTELSEEQYAEERVRLGY